ncbi:MAG: TrkH family potassium uptake protein [Eubacterium sp.]|jgi:trk system potassium uptake protein TrkH|nr:TrkH family potassium uptake protein [Eubacterium sp.]
MNYKIIAFLTGQIMKIGGFLLCIPLIISFCLNEGQYLCYIVPALLLWLSGFFLTFKKPDEKNMRERDGFVIVAVVWLALSFCGALPFYISGKIPNLIDALFETISGFTATGATLLNNVESLSKSLLFWRSFAHWIGGMGVLVFVLAILPQGDGKSIYILRAEMTGPNVGKLVSKTRLSIRILYSIYITLTLIEFVLLFSGGMPFFDSVLTSFSTAGTGGFFHLNLGMAAYDSVYYETVISVFMLLFGINFNLFFFLIIRKFSECFKNEEFLAYLGIIFVSIAAVTINIFSLYKSLGEALRFASFQVISTITTTGLATADYTSWPVFSQCIILILMFIGGCAGSTGGGLKVYRIILLFKTAAKEIKYTLNPRLIDAIKISGKTADMPIVKAVSGYVIIYFFIIAASLLLLSLDKVDLGTAASSVISSINNVGFGFGKIGPNGNYADFSWFSKIVLSIDMLLGRLEIFPILLLFRIKR